MSVATLESPTSSRTFFAPRASRHEWNSAWSKKLAGGKLSLQNFTGSARFFPPEGSQSAFWCSPLFLRSTIALTRWYLARMLRRQASSCPTTPASWPRPAAAAAAP
eukprot:CAMPEP_0173383488 /NCGR_PEP_ID=MMETSP1356-20130122/6069_1 /TAXON_ID=77927 ORGANISM="Hemiselmis virescens, Strain PCC157" /NCGR_SAMPLE_ID=MMETSP1356 /ASSEMBLY_ACC=CAM_ASM_000847 /LENGTH=105 /DNA_ID=CAMNT_0014338401 /DNA_START=172 /DNA_END=487 /DNA_ORIENTATION=-